MPPIRFRETFAYFLAEGFMLCDFRAVFFVFAFVAFPGLAETRAENLANDSGRSLYMRHCAVCHGADLEGNIYWLGDPGRERMVGIPGLRHDIWAQAMPDQRLRAIILGGEAHIPLQHSEYVMPDPMLDANEAEALLRYLREVWRGGAP